MNHNIVQRKNKKKQTYIHDYRCQLLARINNLYHEERDARYLLQELFSEIRSNMFTDDECETIPEMVFPYKVDAEFVLNVANARSKEDVVVNKPLFRRILEKFN